MKTLLEGFRTLLILGRVSNLPTVWSNLLAGWFLAVGEDNWNKLFPVLLGGSLLYTGGMYLNDFCDAGFDAQYGKERPIPAGKISRQAVGYLAVLWFVAGLGCFVSFGLHTFGIALLLLVAIVLYDFHHKNVSWAPWVMGGCRLLLYVIAASAAGNYWDRLEGPGRGLRHELQFISLFYRAVPPGVVPAAIALAFYVAGITYLARGESRPGKPTRRALLLLLMPVAVGCGIYVQMQMNYANAPLHRQSLHLTPVLLVWLLQLYWMAWMLVPLWRKTNPSIGRAVSGLLAGIVLVDMIALASATGPFAVVLFPFFILALLLQRVVPAT